MRVNTVNSSVTRIVSLLLVLSFSLPAPLLSLELPADMTNERAAVLASVRQSTGTYSAEVRPQLHNQFSDLSLAFLWDDTRRQWTSHRPGVRRINTPLGDTLIQLDAGGAYRVVEIERPLQLLEEPEYAPPELLQTAEDLQGFQPVPDRLPRQYEVDSDYWLWFWVIGATAGLGVGLLFDSIAYRNDGNRDGAAALGFFTGYAITAYVPFGLHGFNFNRRERTRSSVIAQNESIREQENARIRNESRNRYQQEVTRITAENQRRAEHNAQARLVVQNLATGEMDIIWSNDTRLISNSQSFRLRGGSTTPLRAGPGMAYDTVGLLRPDQDAVTFSASGSWIHVVTEDVSGWLPRPGSASVVATSTGTLFIDGQRIAEITRGESLNVDNIQTGRRTIQLQYADENEETITVSINSDTTSTVRFSYDYYNIGDRGPAGGVVFYDKGDYSDGWRYLEAAPRDQRSTRWSERNGAVSQTATRIGSGASNTERIINVLGSGNYAARICYDLTLGGFDDWFLPSRDEQMEMYRHKGKIGGFSSERYWSSSEFNDDNAWYTIFEDGRQFATLQSGDPTKPLNRRVRAIRRF